MSKESFPQASEPVNPGEVEERQRAEDVAAANADMAKGPRLDTFLSEEEKQNIREQSEKMKAGSVAEDGLTVEQLVNLIDKNYEVLKEAERENKRVTGLLTEARNKSRTPEQIEEKKLKERETEALQSYAGNEILAALSRQGIKIRTGAIVGNEQLLTGFIREMRDEEKKEVLKDIE